METFKTILKIIAGIVIMVTLHILLTKARGDGEIVEIGGKKYIKKVVYLGSDIYDVKFFPIDSLEKKSEKNLEVIE